MSLGGLVFIAFIVGGLIVGVYALIAGGISFLNRPHVSYSAMRAWAVVMAVWALGWCVGFFGHDPAGNVIGISLAIAFVVLVLAGMVIVARMSFGWWTPLLAGVILAGTYIAGAVGDYAAHAWGWHGRASTATVGRWVRRWESLSPYSFRRRFSWPA